MAYESIFNLIGISGGANVFNVIFIVNVILNKMRNTGKLKNSQSRNGLYSVVHGGYTTCFLSKDIIEKTSWCLPQNKFQRNIPFHKFEDGVKCPSNTSQITHNQALNILLNKYDNYLNLSLIHI